MASAFPGTVAVCIRTVYEFYELFFEAPEDDFIEYMKNVRRAASKPNYISEENLVLLTTCRDRIHQDWNTLSPELQREHSTIPPSVDGLVSRMQLLVLFQKLKDWC
jgi:hypothetical protein